MANYAYTSIAISHPVESTVEKMQKIFVELNTKRGCYDIPFSVLISNFSLNNKLADPGGKIIDVSDVLTFDYGSFKGYKYFIIKTETRYNPNIKIFKKILEIFSVNYIVSFITEEPNCDLYCKFDPLGIFPYNYYIDAPEGDYYETEKDAIEFIQSYFNFNIDDLEKYLIANSHKYDFRTTLIKKINDYIKDNNLLSDDEFFQINKFDIADSLDDF